MKEQFLTYEQSLTLKELGFDELCIAYYDQWVNTNNEVKQMFRVGEVNGVFDNITPAPLYQQAFKFFREKYGLISKINWISALPKHNTFAGLIENTEKEVKLKECETYEEAEDACINKLIEIANEKHR
jgi:hypothetical protein